jgi:DNA-binding transcriptional LysR family regulator
MEWQQLEYFKIVAETQHFTRAAEILSIAQPTLSRSISNLEAELGVPLFERLGRQVILSRYGKLFYKRTCRVLQEVSEAKQELQDIINPDHGSISFAFLQTLGASSVPKLIHHFLNEYPLVNFKIFQNSPNAILDQLEAGEVDLCLSAMTEQRRGIEWIHLWDEEIFAFVSNDHPLANRESVSINELAEYKFVTLKQGLSIRTVFDQIFKASGIEPDITFEGEEVVTVLGFVSDNLGITLLPGIEGFSMEKLKKLTIIEPVFQRNIGLAWNKERYLSPAAKRFLEYIKGYYISE